MLKDFKRVSTSISLLTTACSLLLKKIGLNFETEITNEDQVFFPTNIKLIPNDIKLSNYPSLN